MENELFKLFDTPEKKTKGIEDMQQVLSVQGWHTICGVMQARIRALEIMICDESTTDEKAKDLRRRRIIYMALLKIPETIIKSCQGVPFKEEEMDPYS